jgi:hypothetical protein
MAFITSAIPSGATMPDQFPAFLIAAIVNDIIAVILLSCVFQTQ